MADFVGSKGLRWLTTELGKAEAAFLGQPITPEGRTLFSEQLGSDELFRERLERGLYGHTLNPDRLAFLRSVKRELQGESAPESATQPAQKDTLTSDNEDTPYSNKLGAQRLREALQAGR